MSLIQKLSLLSLFLPLGAHAADPYVPEDLRGWEAWVLEGKEYRQCPFLFNRNAGDRNAYHCAWPGLLDVSVDAASGRFSQQWTVYAPETWVPLPGSAEYWPDAVTANGAAVTVVEHAGVPSVRLEPGSYRLAGRYAWDERPGVLQIPDASGLVALTVNGNRVARPERNGTSLFLGERQRETVVRDSVSAQVYRLVADEVPTRLTTLLRIDVAGGVREELFVPALPDGFIPLSLDSALPARLEPDGALRVQVRPGRWEVTLTARAGDVLNEIAMPAPVTNLPSDEVWSYQSNDTLRVTAAEDLPPVDPQQAQVPAPWQQLPAFRVAAGESLSITERSRGRVATENQLGLERTMWLDFDGGGFVVRDRVNGNMRSDWRLDMAPPYTLLSATESGDNLLITKGDDEGETGVELRRANVNVVGLGRSETRAAMPATGWQSRFANVSARLHLPPGHKLLAAPGVDNAPGSWVSQWQLLDFFLLLITTIAAWRLFGNVAGVVALFALVLSFHEASAPSWLWLNLLAAIALARVAPPGRLRQAVHVYQGTSAVLLVLVLVPFVAGQLRIAIYPQLEPQYGYDYGLADTGVDYIRPEAPAEGFEAGFVDEADRARRELRSVAADTAEEIVVTGMRATPKASLPISVSYSRYAPNAIVQAGPGVPSWQWNTYRLFWSGPVDADQSMRLMILSRWSVTLLRFVEVALLLLFAGVLAAGIAGRQWRLPGGLKLGLAQPAAMLAAAALFTGITSSTPAQAEIPDPQLLQELERRLTVPPDCVPRCAEIVTADVEVSADSVGMTLEVHAFDDIALPLPGSEQGWRPQAVLIDGSSTAQVLRGDDRALWIRVPPGRHTVVLRGAATAADSLEIPFPTPPRVIEVASDGWFVAGIRDRRLLSGSLQLTRLERETGGEQAPRWESSRFPAFVHVERNLVLDIDWRVTTIVSRVAPQQGALTLEIPLLEGESVLTEGITVTDGRALVSMAPNQRVVSWMSSLPRKSPLTLTAERGAPWKEVWLAGIGSIWHAEFDGVPESETQRDNEGARIAEFHPRGGERLTMTTTRPEASAGTTLAFDAVTVNVTRGDRSATVTLDLNYRSTQGAQHVVTLPEDAEVTEVVIDGRIEPLRAEGRELTLPILPGNHSIRVAWRSDEDAGATMQTPGVDVGAPSGNIAINLELPRNRWLLASHGPRLGPAVLYWSELAVLLLFAAILGRIDWTPLKTWHWLLLGLGFSTFNWPVLGVVVVWLLASGARDRFRARIPWWQYNTAQVLLAIFTVVALLSIVASLPGGLLGMPDMNVTGNGSGGNSLRWFADRSESLLPVATAWSLPMWTYKALILAWALWLSFALLRWLPWVWRCFAKDGYWHSRKGDVIGSSAE